MRTAVLAGVMALAGWGAGGARGMEKADHRVTLYVQRRAIAYPVLFARAEAVASRIFAGIGVHLNWEMGGPRPAGACLTSPGAEIVIRLTTHEPHWFHEGSPAFSRPYAPPSAAQIVIFYDRAAGPATVEFNDRAVFLGHVLAHEIGHVLQGIVRHSAEGVMKAQWSAEDWVEMRKRPLAFTGHDADLIRMGLAKRKRDFVARSR